MDDRTYQPPAARLMYGEGPRFFRELASLVSSAPFLLGARRGDGHAVLVLPGFGGSDRSTAVIRRYLESLGYDAHGWGLGTNLGPAMEDLPSRLSHLLESIHDQSGNRKVSLVGWSLGGVYARLLAQLYPEKVRQVITLGSPFAGHPRSTRIYPITRPLIDRPLQNRSINELRLLAGSPLETIPNTNIFSRQDAIVPWEIATEATDHLTENIEVFAGHLGLGFSAPVLFAIADRLAQQEGEWKPFRRYGWRRPLYGPADLDHHLEAETAGV